MEKTNTIHSPDQLALLIHGATCTRVRFAFTFKIVFLPEGLQRLVSRFPGHSHSLDLIPDGFRLKPFHPVPQDLRATVLFRRCPRHLTTRQGQEKQRHEKIENKMKCNRGLSRQISQIESSAPKDNNKRDIGEEIENSGVKI